jgi:hypothetical protein
MIFSPTGLAPAAHKPSEDRGGRAARPVHQVYVTMRRWALSVAVAAGLFACAAPSVPIPPPQPERMSFEVDVAGGTARFSYEPVADYAGAVVYVFNRDAGQGVITTADGDGGVAPTEPFPAAEGDEIVVSFELESQIASTCVRLRDGQSSSSLECDL